MSVALWATLCGTQSYKGRDSYCCLEKRVFICLKVVLPTLLWCAKAYKIATFASALLWSLLMILCSTDRSQIPLFFLEFSLSSLSIWNVTSVPISDWGALASWNTQLASALEVQIWVLRLSYFLCIFFIGECNEHQRIHWCYCGTFVKQQTSLQTFQFTSDVQLVSSTSNHFIHVTNSSQIRWSGKLVQKLQSASGCCKKWFRKEVSQWYLLCRPQREVTEKELQPKVGEGGGRLEEGSTRIVLTNCRIYNHCVKRRDCKCCNIYKSAHAIFHLLLELAPSIPLFLWINSNRRSEYWIRCMSY